MRVLLSTIGSRGDVQPLVALALELRALGQEVRLCVPPDFRDRSCPAGGPTSPLWTTNPTAWRSARSISRPCSDASQSPFTTAARALQPQPRWPAHPKSSSQMYDQPYWAQRIHHLGIGTAHAPGTPTLDSLTNALEGALHPDVAARARSIATAVRRDGTQVAARQISSLLS
jgi:UDP:flavonoid glycosyltransferase YjiC (YdhE family)